MECSCLELSKTKAKWVFIKWSGRPSGRYNSGLGLPFQTPLISWNDLHQNGPCRKKKLWRQRRGGRKKKLLNTCLKPLFQITAFIPLPSPLFPHTQIPVWVYVVKAQISRWRPKCSLVIWKFIQMFHHLPPKHYTSEVRKCYASHCLPHVFIYENKCFLGGK